MSDLFAAGASLIASVFKSHGSQSATYSRPNADGTTYSVTIYVTLAKGAMPVVGDAGQVMLTDVNQQDFLLSTSDLILNGSTVEPQMGDRITTTIGGQSRTYQVAYQDNDRAYSHDAHKSMYRVRTKRIT